MGKPRRNRRGSTQCSFLQAPELKKGLNTGNIRVGVLDISIMQHPQEHSLTDLIELDILTLLRFRVTRLYAVFRQISMYRLANHPRILVVIAQIGDVSRLGH